MPLNKQFISYLFAFLFFCLTLPYFVWHTPIFRHLLEIFLIGISLFFVKSKIKMDELILIIVLVILVTYSFLDNLLISNYVSLLFLIVIFILKDDCKISVFKAYTDIFAFFVGISLITYITVFWLNIPLQHEYISPLNELKDGGYIHYPFLVTIDSNYNFGNMRFHALFDEPGVVGTISAILLYSNGYKLNSLKYLIIFLAGLFSFSFFFIGITLIFFLVKKNYIFYVLSILLFFGIILIIFKQFFIDYIDLFDKLLFSRFTNSGGYGGSRTSYLFNQEYVNLFSSADFLCGKGSEMLSKIIDGGSSYKSLIYSYGIIWFFLLIFFFIYNGYKIIHNRNNFFFFILIFLGVIYQRPGVFDIVYFFLFITLPLIININFIDEKKHFSFNHISNI